MSKVPVREYYVRDSEVWLLLDDKNKGLDNYDFFYDFIDALEKEMQDKIRANRIVLFFHGLDQDRKEIEFEIKVDDFLEKGFPRELIRAIRRLDKNTLGKVAYVNLRDYKKSYDEFKMIRYQPCLKIKNWV